MIDEEARRRRAYQIWESEGRPEGRELAHWYQADGEASVADKGAHYLLYSTGPASAGSLVIKFYHSGDQVRGYVRKIAKAGEDDSIFPGEEMEPEAAFKLAESHKEGSGKPVFVELTEGVQWDPHWGALGRNDLDTVPDETNEFPAADNSTGAPPLTRVPEAGTGREVKEKSDKAGKSSRRSSRSGAQS